MGWRDINMNRRKPRLDVAVVPMGEGEDREAAVLHSDGGAARYLTACDHAADRMQTHHPTAVLRLDPAERAIVEAALARL